MRTGAKQRREDGTKCQKKNLAKCRTRTLLRPGSLSTGSQAPRVLAGSRWRGIHNDQAKNHCDAHQLLQIRRLMEIKTCLDSSKKDRLPGHTFFPRPSGKQLESERMSLLRRAFAREAYKYTDKLRTLSDITLRRRLRFPIL